MHHTNASLRTALSSSAYQWSLHYQLAVLSLSSHYGIAGITIISSQYGIDATIAWCAKKSEKRRCYSLVDFYLDPGVLIKLVLINNGTLASKLKLVHPHLVFNNSCISHFCSILVKTYELKKNIERRKLMFSLQRLLTSLCLRHNSQRPHQSLITPVILLRATPRFPFRPLDGRSVPASAVSAKSNLPGLLYVGITVFEFSIAIGVSPLSRNWKATAWPWVANLHPRGTRADDLKKPRDHRND